MPALASALKPEILYFGPFFGNAHAKRIYIEGRIYQRFILYPDGYLAIINLHIPYLRLTSGPGSNQGGLLSYVGRHALAIIITGIARAGILNHMEF